MRKIKFRGYDKELEKMTYFDDEEYDYRPPLAFRLDQVFKKDSNYDDYEDFEYNDITDKLEIMQYTGLKDKNGKEIYEGDIVKIGKNKKATIEWDKYCGFKIDFLNSIEWVDFSSAYLRMCEVIGDIYSNSELLEANND